MRPAEKKRPMYLFDIHISDEVNLGEVNWKCILTIGIFPQETCIFCFIWGSKDT